LEALFMADRESRSNSVRLTHVTGSGAARMVDVGEKTPSRRRALAEGRIAMALETLSLVRENRAAKGDVLAVARVAGIGAAKRTWELIPLCHGIPIDQVAVEFQLAAVESSAPLVAAGDLFSRHPLAPWSGPGIWVRAEASTTARTGVEMEALTAVSVALLTLYDMLKAVDRGMQIEAVRLLRKAGGRSGEWRREP
jgi:cyclic pyranopterin phosphate synthase